MDDNRRSASQRGRWLAVGLCLAVVTGSVAAPFFDLRGPMERAGSSRSAGPHSVVHSIEPATPHPLVHAGAPAEENRAQRDDGVHNLVPELTAACQDDRPYYVTVCYPSGSDMSPRSSPSVVIFRDTPTDQPQYAAAFFRDVGAI